MSRNFDIECNNCKMYYDSKLKECPYCNEINFNNFKPKTMNELKLYRDHYKEFFDKYNFFIEDKVYDSISYSIYFDETSKKYIIWKKGIRLQFDNEEDAVKKFFEIILNKQEYIINKLVKLFLIPFKLLFAIVFIVIMWVWISAGFDENGNFSFENIPVEFRINGKIVYTKEVDKKNEVSNIDKESISNEILNNSFNEKTNIEEVYIEEENEEHFDISEYSYHECVDCNHFYNRLNEDIYDFYYKDGNYFNYFDVWIDDNNYFCFPDGTVVTPNGLVGYYNENGEFLEGECPYEGGFFEFDGLFMKNNYYCGKEENGYIIFEERSPAEIINEKIFYVN